MKCPECGGETQVKDSRPTGSGSIKRRRWCAAGHRFTTLETQLGAERPRDLRVLRDTPEVKMDRRLRSQRAEREPWSAGKAETNRLGVIAAATKRASAARLRGEQRRRIEARDLDRALNDAIRDPLGE